MESSKLSINVGRPEIAPPTLTGGATGIPVCGLTSNSNVLLPETMLALGSTPGAERDPASVLKPRTAGGVAVALGTAETSGTMADALEAQAPLPLVAVLHSVE